MLPLLTSKAVCKLLDISPATLSRMVRTNRIPYVLLSTGRRKLIVRFREAELEAWVERNQAPQAVLAVHRTNGQQDRSRPLCPYPKVAMYKGRGSTDEAANFECRES